MKKISIVAVVGMALVGSISYAQPAAEYRVVPAGQQKLVPSANGLTSQYMLSEPKSGTATITSRNKTGLSEIHADWIDHIFVQEGGATMMLGGEIKEPKETGPGETRGSGVTGGKSFPMKPGDYFYIPAKTVHQMVLAPGQTIRYAVVKARN